MDRDFYQKKLRIGVPKLVCGNHSHIRRPGVGSSFLGSRGAHGGLKSDSKCFIKRFFQEKQPRGPTGKLHGDFFFF